MFSFKQFLSGERNFAVSGGRDVVIFNIQPKQSKEDNDQLVIAFPLSPTPATLAVLNCDAKRLDEILLKDTQEDLAPLLLCAIEQGYEEIATDLVNRGADVNAKRDADGKTALILSVDRNLYNLSQLLLSRKAECNICDAFGSSPLSLATGHGNIHLEALLKTYGAQSSTDSTRLYAKK